MSLKNKKEYSLLIEPFISSMLKKDDYNISSTASSNLLDHNRLDLAFKLFYLDNILSAPKVACEVYKEDIRAQTMGKFSEYQNDNKNTFKDYLSEFDKIYNDINKRGFDENKSIVPISSENSIINGAHRVASCIHLKKSLSVLETDMEPLVCNYEYFLNRNVPKDILEKAVNTFTIYVEGVYVAFLWPSGAKNREKSFDAFDRVVYQKDISLTFKGAKNLLIELYKHMDWVGGIENNFEGIERKLLECFPNFSPLKVILFQSDSLENVKEIKAKVREINGLGFSSIHITDTKEEAIRISNLVFNSNGLHFINHSNPYHFSYVQKAINYLKDRCKHLNIAPEEVLIDGSFILALYGIRKGQDVDFFESGDKGLATNEVFNIESHDSQLKYFSKTKSELIFDPSNHFVYLGVKFVSFNILFEMKSKRGELKDINDIKIMKSLIDNNRLSYYWSLLVQNTYYFQLKVKSSIFNSIINTLHSTGSFNIVRKLYRWLKYEK